MNLVELFDWQALSARTGLKAQKIHETSQDFALEVFLQIRCCRVLSEVCKPGPGQCPGQCPGWQYFFVSHWMVFTVLIRQLKALSKLKHLMLMVGRFEQ